jgi:pilus assembly protein Flp/PilA
MQMTKFITKLLNDESGQDLIEYALIAALVGIGTLSAMKALGNNTGKAFNGLGTSLTNART